MFLSEVISSFIEFSFELLLKIFVNIKEIDLSSTGKVTVNDKILPISSSSKFKDYIYLTVGEEVYTNYKFKYDEKENTLCLLDDKDKCIYYFNLKESTE